MRVLVVVKWVVPTQFVKNIFSSSTKPKAPANQLFLNHTPHYTPQSTNKTQIKGLRPYIITSALGEV